MSEKENLGDKIEDVLDSVQDIVYGPGDDFTHDIPATIKTDSGRRVINKVQTRRNIRDRILGTKGKIIFLIIMGVVLLIGLLVSIFG